MPESHWQTADGISLVQCFQGGTELCPITFTANAVRLKRLACKSLSSASHGLLQRCFESDHLRVEIAHIDKCSINTAKGPKGTSIR